MSEKTDDLFTVMTIINCLMRFMSHMNTIWIVTVLYAPLSMYGCNTRKLM